MTHSAAMRIRPARLLFRLALTGAVIAAAHFAAGPPATAEAAQVSRTYSYFSVGGSSLAEIEQELERRGPQVASGARHPGATSLQFSTSVTYAQRNGRCGVEDAQVSVRATVILPRWRRPRGADDGTRLIWDTLAADIKRHEESHVSIARNHARELEAELKRIRNRRDCEAAAARVQAVTDRVLARHDAEQARFDRIEARNFERRLMRLLDYRLQRIEAARGGS